MPQGVYETLVNASADIDALNNALNAGADVKGAVLASALAGKGMARFLLR
jgi:hypothetical protein